MKRMIDCAGEPLHWEQPNALYANYELRDSAHRVASLRLHCRTAKAKSADGAWRFTRSGYLRQMVIVRACADDTEMGRLVRSPWPWQQDELRLPDGRRLRTRSNFWQTWLSLCAEDGTDLIRCQRHLTLKMSGKVQMLAAATMPELPWLVCLGWYLAVAAEAESVFGLA